MQNIFDQITKEKLISRIQRLNIDSKAQWGKMNLCQMLKHNIYWNKWILGKVNRPYHQAFMGKLFGKMALRKMIKDEKIFDKNIPTSNQFKVKESSCDIEIEKIKWIELINSYNNFDNPNFIHDFFGKMTKEEIGILVYKHTDHHLRQFNL